MLLKHRLTTFISTMPTRSAAKLEPTNARFLLTHARTLRALGLVGDALRAATALLRLQPHNHRALRLRACVGSWWFEF